MTIEKTTAFSGGETRPRATASLAGLAFLAALLSAGAAFAHGPGGPGQGPGFGAPGMMTGPGTMTTPGMMMGLRGGQGTGGCPGTMTTPWYGGGQGFGAPGMMMGPGMMTGPGMMAPRGGQQFGGGPGMMVPGQGGPGAMAPRGGPGMMAPGPRTALPGEDLTAEDVRARLRNWLRHMGNPRLELGEVKEVDEDTIIADIVTKEGKVLVDRFRIDRHTGAMERAG